MSARRGGDPEARPSLAPNRQDDNSSGSVTSSGGVVYRQRRITYWDNYVRKTSSRYYHRRLGEIYRSIVPPGQRVLELGCGGGDLLAAVEPSFGVGVDFSSRMISDAARRHPALHFIVGDVHEICLRKQFDYIVLSDLVNELWDVQTVIERIIPVCSPDTRIIINTYSRMWELPLAIVRWLRLANPVLSQNWLTREDLENMLSLAGFETIRAWPELLCPLPIPPVNSIFNRCLVKIPPISLGALANFLIARPDPGEARWEAEPLVSVIVPARNEAGNVEDVFRRVPEMGAGTEIVFVEGHSRDDTFAAIERARLKFPQRRCQLFRQTGLGKGDAVRLGFERASGEVLMILDADLTVAPEDLPRFYQALRSRRGEFINGVRLVYPMENQAMRFLNLIGNKFFSLAFSWLLGQKVKDTLCGTKVLSRRHYLQIARNRSYFGDFDPFGDFDLLFGAARLNLRIVDMPIRYRERKYGQTNISRWRHGWLLLRMVAYGTARMKLI